MRGRNDSLGTHGTALSTIIKYYRPQFGFADFMRIIDYMPYVVEMTFDDNGGLYGMKDILIIKKEYKR